MHGARPERLSRDGQLLRFLSRVVGWVDVFDLPRADTVELHDGILFSDSVVRHSGGHSDKGSSG
jgi:hypothetical protein